MVIENDKDYEKWSQWLGEHEALSILCCQETCGCWDIREYLCMYEIKQTEEDKKEIKMNILHNYECSLPKAMADAKAQNILSFKWGDAIYEANKLGKYKQKTQIVDVDYYAVSGGVFSLDLI